MTAICDYSIDFHIRVRIRELEMLVFRKMLRTYLMDDPCANYKMQNRIFKSYAKFMRKAEKQI